MKAFSRILCPVDLTEDSERTLRYAAALARWYSAPLTVLHVFGDEPRVDMIPSLVDVIAANTSQRQQHRRVADEAVRRLAEAVVPHDVTFDVVVEDDQDVAPQIDRRATLERSSLIVMGTEGRQGLARWLRGSTAEAVIHKADHTVLVVPASASSAVPPGHVAFDDVLCAIEFSECALEVASAATLLATDADARLTLVSVVKPGSNDVVLASTTRHLWQLVPESAARECRVETMVRYGEPWRELLAVADERSSDIIVMGVSSRGLLSRAFSGSTAHEVIRAAHCPVLLVTTRAD